jgi:hypothetical protein
MQIHDVRDVNNLSDLNLNNVLETLELLCGVIELGCGLHSYLWYSNALPKNLQVMLVIVRTFIKLKNVKNQW